MSEGRETGAGWPLRLINQLERLARFDDPERANRGALAALRRGLGKELGEAPEMFPYVVPALGAEARDSDQETAYLLASLFALHPCPSSRERGTAWRDNFGTSFHHLDLKVDSDSIERRFVALLNCHRDDLSEHLRHGVSLLKTHDVSVNWLQLIRDVRNWENPNRRTQLNWANAFWGSGEPVAAESTSNETPDS